MVGVLGAQFAKLGEAVPWIAASPNFKAPPTLAKRVEDPHAEHRSPDSLPWPVQQIAPPEAASAGDQGIGTADKLLASQGLSAVSGVRVFYPAGANGVYSVSYVPAKAQGQRTIYIDPGSGAVLRDISWNDYSPGAKAVEWGVMTHMGKQFGRVNQLFNLLVVLVLTATVVLGIYLWLSRRPPGTWGVPAVREGDKLPAGMKLGLAALAILFPLAGISMIAVLGWQFATNAWRH